MSHQGVVSNLMVVVYVYAAHGRKDSFQQYSRHGILRHIFAFHKEVAFVPREGILSILFDGCQNESTHYGTIF